MFSAERWDSNKAMIVELNGSRLMYELQSVCQLFFPDTDFSSDDGRRLYCDVKDGVVNATLHYAGRTYSACAPLEDIYDAERIALKGCAYRLMSSATGRSSPWGLLTGIKSALFYDKIRGAHAEAADDIFERLYMVCPDKIELCRQVLSSRKRALDVCAPDSVSLYVSVPFCPGKCSYCSFVSSALPSDGMLEQYIDILCRELEQKGEFIARSGYRITCVYIGGGTPTVLSEALLDRLLGAVERCFDLSHMLEYTVEAGRPDTFSVPKLDVLARRGVTRVSINPQTLNPEALRAIGRRHTAEDFFKAYDMACKYDFVKNIDVIAGLPCDTFDTFRSSIDTLSALGAENVTLHTLYIKKASDPQIHAMLSDGSHAELTGRMVAYAERRCSERGYTPYYLYRQKNTIGNHENVGYAVPGTEGLYNILMMDDIQTVIAAGANAVSKFVLKDKMLRLANTKYAYNYIKDSYRDISDFYRAAELQKAD